MALTKSAAKRLLGPLLLAAVVYVFWSTVFVWPLRVFVVLLHEVSHGLAAVLTGGRIVSIELSPLEGGLCTTAGGWPFVIASAGYLGSAFFGALFLVLGFRGRPRTHRTVTGVLGAALVLLTLVYVRSAFGFAYGLVAGALLLAVARWLPEGASSFVLRLLGVTSLLYAPWDITSDLILRSIPASDAGALARMTGIPALAWGVLWLAASLAIAWRALKGVRS
ncbi:MAG: M50 family metallopeptidase [Thermoanaerobaculia bacterium]|nr:M50 family metallopeptidase [Thermoanaerobaculia bacterium]